MKVLEKIEDIRIERRRSPTATWGLVPTMGYLHEGHLSLVKTARAQNDYVGVSIFVNPIQFNNAEDFAKYPQNLQQDLDLLAEEKVDAVWTPGKETVYPAKYETYVEVEKLATPLEGAARPGHLKGVTTVVAKLFNVFQPTRAYFGEKDAQQLRVINRMTRDLNFDIEIVSCPTTREKDGLAMSSRNARLTPEGRRQATCVFKALQKAYETFSSGERESSKIKQKMADVISASPRAKIDYLSIADTETLQELDSATSTALVSLAVFIDNIRLIDNITLDKYGEPK